MTSEGQFGLTRRDVLAGATAVVAGAAAGARPAGAWATTAIPAQAAGRTARHGGGAAQRGVEVAARAGRDREGRFGLMFKKLEPFAPPDELLTALAQRMADPGSPPGVGDAFDNPRIPSGFTFLGQFVDHDMTLDLTPLTDQQVDPVGLANFDSPVFDLASLYGEGPDRSRDLYDPDRSGKLLLVRREDADGRIQDLPRRGDGSALIGDARNDENLIVCQLHIAFAKFHNRLIRQGLPFAQARRQTQWHFQWILVHDFLPHVVGEATVNRFLVPRDNGRIRCNREHYKPRNPQRPMIPVEYAVAAYRFGHSMVRNGYLMNRRVGGPMFTDPPVPAALHGSRPVPPAMKIDWGEFFVVPGATAPPHNLARRIDATLSTSLHRLPPSVVPPDVEPRIPNLAERNLLRGKRVGLSDGQSVARAMGVAPLSNADLGLTEAGWAGKAPLWFYILKEAELQQAGERLGEVGGRIVAETILGILDADKQSYFNERDWVPTRPIAPARGEFRTGDLLAYAEGE